MRTRAAKFDAVDAVNLTARNRAVTHFHRPLDPNGVKFIRPGRSPGNRFRINIIVHPNGVKQTALRWTMPYETMALKAAWLSRPVGALNGWNEAPVIRGFARGLMNLAPSVLPKPRPRFHPLSLWERVRVRGRLYRVSIPSPARPQRGQIHQARAQPWYPFPHKHRRSPQRGETNGAVLQAALGLCRAASRRRLTGASPAG